MWLQLSQILKKNSAKETRENQHFFLLGWRHKNQKNTRGYSFKEARKGFSLL